MSYLTTVESPGNPNPNQGGGAPIQNMKLTTVSTETITITKKDNEWYINGNAKIVGKEVQSNNGVIHSIDTVLLPKKN